MDFLFFATQAMAQDGAAAPKGPSAVEMLMLPVGFLIIMYFFIIRPQQKKLKQHSVMLSGLKAGDEVVTNGGIIGRVKSVAEAFVTVEVAHNTNLKVLKSAVTGLAKDQLSAPAPVGKEQPAKS